MKKIFQVMVKKIGKFMPKLLEKLCANLEDLKKVINIIEIVLDIDIVLQIMFMFKAKNPSKNRT